MDTKQCSGEAHVGQERKDKIRRDRPGGDHLIVVGLQKSDGGSQAQERDEESRNLENPGLVEFCQSRFLDADRVGLGGVVGV